ncbi:MAG: hypothetical protein PCALPYG88_2816 [uncultured Paraburkholderia sp.]|nr:MAG: hypothetical protein PCALPYG08_2334 [uncultured Paraburkholderia sp.]CAH2921862.1 MAG: hypothetical protein PCALPYG88_2816 [uncultured Paraburkholderia sp.]
MYTPASGKKQVTDLRELRNASHRLRHWNPRSKSTALHAPLLAGPSHRGAAQSAGNVEAACAVCR